MQGLQRAYLSQPTARSGLPQHYMRCRTVFHQSDAAYIAADLAAEVQIAEIEYVPRDRAGACCPIANALISQVPPKS